MVYAFQNTPLMSFHKGNVGLFSILIYPTGGVTTGTIKLDGGPDFFTIHGWVMWAAWGVLGAIMLISNRYMKSFFRAHIWVHIVSGIFILIGTYIVGFIAMEELGWDIANLPHTIVGFIILVLVGLIVIGGIIAKFTMVTYKWKTKGLLINKYGHKFFGYFMIAFSQVSIILGIVKYTTFYGLSSVLAVVHSLVFVFFLGALEIGYQIFQRRQNPFRDVDERITIEEFRKKVESGEKLVILDDMILDVTNFAWNHPGGKFVIDQNIGKDVSKFFFGGYVLEPS